MRATSNRRAAPNPGRPLPRHHPAPRRRRGSGVLELAAGVVALIGLAVIFVPWPAGRGPAATVHVEQPDLDVAVVPAADSAGFFVALHEGLFAARGLHVRFVPAISSETVINDQALNVTGARHVDISCGNYVSYIEAQQAWDQGKRPSAAARSPVAADLDIFAEGSVMEPGAQGLYVMPRSRVRTLASLEGRTIGVNVPGGILYLLTASALAAQGLPVSGVRFAYIPLPAMAAALKAGKITAAVLPEPFASQAELSLGVVPLTDFDQGATEAFPVQGCAVTRAWAARHPRTLAAFRTAFERGQRIADTSRSAVEQAMEALPAPLGLTPVQAAVLALDSYPVGPVDAPRLQRVADVMREFLGFPPFSIKTMLMSG
jgi:NitT/TauT family transport system substrate-binding protein